MSRLKNLPEALAKDWAPKILCLAIALFLFLFYRLSTLETKTFSAPLQLENASALTPSVPYLKIVRVSLRGERDNVYALAENDVIPYIDIAAATGEGEITLPVKLRLSEAAAASDPLNVTIDPSEITVVLEKKATRTLPVSCVLADFPEDGYNFESFALNPDSVKVSGPQSLVESLDDIKTEPISLAGLNATVDGTVSLVSPGDLLSFEDSNSVSYRLSISPEISDRRFDGVRVTFGPLIHGLEMATSPVTGSLVVRGPRAVLARWTPPSSLLFVLCSDITEPGRYTLDVRANVPQEFSVVSLNPQTVTVTVRERQ